MTTQEFGSLTTKGSKIIALFVLKVIKGPIISP